MTKPSKKKARTQQIRIATDRLDYVFDTEFIDDGKTIELISIGVACDDGRELYACNSDAPLHLASDWVRENVLPHLPHYDSPAWAPKDEIAIRLTQFTILGKKPPRFWAYYADYDWVALCQLYGKMLDLPESFQKFCWDLKQYSAMVGSPKHPRQHGTAHDAREDARYGLELLHFLRSIG